jgi:hypothetical protein
MGSAFGRDGPRLMELHEKVDLPFYESGWNVQDSKTNISLTEG